MTKPENLLPLEVLQRASLRGREYAWPIECIPDVIETARAANLLNIGGQLQFRLLDGLICECYWIEVDTYKSVPSNLRWADRVALSAEVALKDFTILRSTKDFLSEGRTNFGKYLAAHVADSGSPEDAMCFVWYLETEIGEKQMRVQSL